MKLKPCPWCGWRSVTIRTYEGKDEPDEYSILCNHCGFQSRKSRYIWRTKWAWNHRNDMHERKKYHLYGREY